MMLAIYLLMGAGIAYGTSDKIEPKNSSFMAKVGYYMALLLFALIWPFLVGVAIGVRCTEY
jgi:hypothetical protein